jgi:parallel beta-helix repeat protein
LRTGTYSYDPKDKLLCVHPTDSAGAAHHLYSAVSEGTGVTLADYTAVDGLAIAGFSRAAIWGEYKTGVTVENCVLHDNGFGISLGGCKDCAIRGNVLWNNNPDYEAGAQIYVQTAPIAEGILVENNVVHDCASRSGISFYGALGVRCTARGNLTYRNQGGLLFKTGGEERPGSLVGQGNVCVFNSSGDLGAPWGGFNTFGGEMRHKPHDTDLLLGACADWKFADLDYFDFRLQSDSPARGAAPGGKDLGAMPYDGSVRFVRPDGDDAAEGTSLASAWKTLSRAARALRPGQTLYLAPGEWKEPLLLAGIRAGKDKPTAVRVRGKGKAILHSVAVENCDFLTLEGLRVTGAENAGVALTHCQGVKLLRSAAYGNGGAGIEIAASRETQIDGCGLALNRRAGLEAQSGCAGLEIVDTIFFANGGPQISLAETPEGFWSECNVLAGGGKAPTGRIAAADAADLPAWRALSKTDARSRAASAADFVDPAKGDFRVFSGTDASFLGRYVQCVGPDGVTPGKRIARHAIERVEVLSTTATSANITYWTPGRVCGTAVEWGTAAAKYDGRLDRAGSGAGSEYETFHTVSLVGLRPETTHHFRVGFCDFEADAERKAAGRFPMVWSADGVFTTPAGEPAPRSLFVSPAGDDANDGLSPATAWRTLHKAARQARAGDTVTLAPGRYMELLRPLQTGVSAGRRITFRAEKPLTVFLDGGFILWNREGRSHDIQVCNKAFLTFDGLTCENCCTMDNGGYRGGIGYAGLIRISGSAGIEIKNCVLDGRTRIMCGLYFFDAGAMPGVPDDETAYTVSDSVFLYNWKAVGGGHSTRPALLLNNAFVRDQITIFDPYGWDEKKLRLRNNIFQSLILGKRGDAMLSGIPAKEYDSDYNCFHWDAENDVKVVATEDGRDGGPKIRGLATWTAKTGFDAHSIEADPGYPLSALMGFGKKGGDNAPGMDIPTSRRLRIEDLVLPGNSPCRRAGMNGEDIGPRWGRFLKE